jgi:glycosyltransferase involved in cell wall biosynthesis
MDGTMKTPLLSVCVPVYNGANYLGTTLESVLAQTFDDYEILISDNGSTDATVAIAAAFAARDERIHIVRFEKNQGPLKNFNRLYELARGRYLKFTPHDDLFDPRYLEKCIAELEADPSVVACNSHVAIIDEKGVQVKLSEVRLDADLPQASSRFYALLNNEKCFDLFSVIRKDALDRMPQPLLAPYGHTDGVLLARLGMLGRIRHLPEALYFNRDYKERSGNKYKTYREYTYFLDPSRRGDIVFPRWRMGIEFFRTVGMFPLEVRERARCYLLVARWYGWYWQSLVWNLLDAAGMVLKGEASGRRHPIQTIG